MWFNGIFGGLMGSNGIYPLVIWYSENGWKLQVSWVILPTMVIFDS